MGVVATGAGPGLQEPLNDRARVVELDAKVRELQRANTILRQAATFILGGARPPTALRVQFVDAHKDVYGVEPITAALQDTCAAIAPST